VTQPARSHFLYSLLCVCAAFSVNAGVQETNLPPLKQVLFICTGNHYRSRFAESFFNQTARKSGLKWSAISRGLRLVPSQHGMSSLALRELTRRGVPQELCDGPPKALTKEDLDRSDYIVLMDEAEHRPMLEKGFRDRDDGRIYYWHIGDSGKMNPSTACQAMSRDIRRLVRALALRQ
jgi:protein-tyrosine phosphatase